VVVLAEPLTLSALMQREQGTTTAMLDELMPDRPLRLPRHLRAERQNAERKTSLWRGQTSAHDRLRAERAETIRLQRLQLGWTAQQIASYHAITRQHVNRILRGQVAA
jgi:CRP-like cAMP-binding protein